MAVPMIMIGGWVVLAFVMSAFPSNDHHWRRAYVLIALGLPVLGWISWVYGPIYGVIGLLVGCSVLRWPVYYLWQWMKRQVGR
ncbi:MAG: DUF2484 family protein [Pseudomonadota bacterium]